MCVYDLLATSPATTTPHTARWFGMKEAATGSSFVAVSLSDDSLALARRGLMRSTPRVDDRWTGMRVGAPRTQGVICEMEHNIVVHRVCIRSTTLL